ncbi:hypothetical protein ACHAXH_005754 [Discostella pseudostelligera]
MEMPFISPAKRHHSQISTPSSTSSSSPLSAATTVNPIDDNHDQHEHGATLLQPQQHSNPLEHFMQFFGSTFRSSSLQSSNDKKLQQQQASQQYRAPVESIAVRPSIRPSAAVHCNNNISMNQQHHTQSATAASSRNDTATAMTDYDAMLAGTTHNNNRLASSSASSESVTFPEPTTSSAWRVALCPRTNQPYYWNIVTRESRWKKPLELASAEEVESIRNKERKQREFFECMERNILRRLMEQGGDGGYSSSIVSSTGGIATTSSNKEIDQYWMQPTATITAYVSPVKSNDGINGNSNDWIAGWITPNSETEDGGGCGGGSTSPSGSLISIQTLSEFGSFDKCSSNSLGDSLDWSHLGSLGSESREEEHGDEVYPLPTSAKPSKLERIKSSSSKPVIDKPSLIRTISKMEHDMLVARQLNPNLRIKANKVNSSSVTPNEWNCLDSPRTVSETDETKKLNRDDIINEPLSPTTETCDILSSLRLTQDSEGMNICLDESVPTSPLTPNDTDDDDDAATPSQVRSSMGSPDGRVSVTTSDAVPTTTAYSTVTKPSLTKRNTCGTIYLGSTLSAPDKEALIKCVCGVFRAHLLQAKPSHATPSPGITNEYDVFRDRRATGDYRHLDTTSIPSLATITDYFRSIFLRSQMEVECIIISLIYIERVIKLTDAKLAPQPANWRSVLFSCMVLASKVWDDLSMWNCDFSKIVPSGVTFSLARTNELEIALLRALKYKVKVNSSEYAKYYFLLRGMLCKSGLANDDLTRLEALDVKGALHLLDSARGGSGGVAAGASFESNGGSVGSSVAKVLMKKRCKSYGVVERGSMTRSTGEEGSCEIGSKSPQCINSYATKVSLEQIVQMR